MKKDKVVAGEEGMIWGSFDTKKPLIERVDEAILYFEQKYGVKANMLFINPETLGNNGIKISGLKIISDPFVLKNNFYVYCKKGK